MATDPEHNELGNSFSHAPKTTRLPTRHDRKSQQGSVRLSSIVMSTSKLDSPAWHTTGAILHTTNTVAETWSCLRGPFQIYLLTSLVRFKMLVLELVLEVAVAGVSFAPLAFPKPFKGQICAV